MKKIICECCGKEIDTEWEELEERVMWNGKVCLCCEECRQVVDEENNINEITYDDYMSDIIVDEKRLG